MAQIKREGERERRVGRNRSSVGNLSPALIDCLPKLLDKAPRDSNSTLIWHREMDRNMANSIMRLAAAIAEQRL